MQLMGFKSTPVSEQLASQGGRLPEFGTAMREINLCLLRSALQGCDHVTLDLDASAIHANKENARRTYQGERGYRPVREAQS